MPTGIAVNPSIRHLVNVNDYCYYSPMKEMYVYIMTNQTNKVFYIGVTNNLIRRMYEHKSKFIDSFTEKYKINKLIYFEIYQDEINAIAREKYLKKAYRKYKENLIRKTNPQYNDLFDSLI